MRSETRMLELRISTWMKYLTMQMQIMNFSELVSHECNSTSALTCDVNARRVVKYVET